MLKGFLSTLITSTCKDINTTIDDPSFTCQIHSAPPGVDYSTNPTVFGEILRGELPAQVLFETPNLLAFRDKSPRAPFHALVIPKQYIPTVRELKRSDAQLVLQMRELGLALIKSEYPEACKERDYMLCFHIPPPSRYQMGHERFGGCRTIEKWEESRTVPIRINLSVFTQYY